MIVGYAVSHVTNWALRFQLLVLQRGLLEIEQGRPRASNLNPLRQKISLGNSDVDHERIHGASLPLLDNLWWKSQELETFVKGEG